MSTAFDPDFNEAQMPLQQRQGSHSQIYWPFFVSSLLRYFIVLILCSWT